MSPYEKITTFLKENKLDFVEIEHPPVYTSEQAAAVRGLSLSQGAKSLLIKGDGKFQLLIIPGDKRLDTKKVKKIFGWKDLRFARPEEVKEQMGCEIGACYPFGNLIDVEMVVDPALSRNTDISFNPGVHTKSIKLKWEDYQRAVKPRLVSIIQVAE